MAPPPDEDEKSKKKKGGKLPPLPDGGVGGSLGTLITVFRQDYSSGTPVQPGGNLRESETVPLPTGARLQGRTPEKHIGSVD